MGCSTCTNGTDGLPKGCKNNGICGINGCGKLTVFDWLDNMESEEGEEPYNIVEVSFKNTSKDYFVNHENLPLVIGEAVAVEASPGHDIGMISLTGKLVQTQIRKKKLYGKEDEFKKVYRKAKQTDLEKWKEAKALEDSSMFKARAIAKKLGLTMKISDCEFQGDKTKAVLYYTADERVDFRELIKELSGELKVRVEMKQIGSRQEAGRIGGIGSCGRELCCSTWLTDFRSVSTNAARYQQLSINPAKIAGQCGKLKCCLNYELDAYMDALKNFPDTKKKLKTKKGMAFHRKTDIFKELMWYSYADEPENFIPITVENVKAILELNKKGEVPEKLIEEVLESVIEVENDYENVVGQDDLTRFDKPKKKKKNNRNKNKKKTNFNQPKAEGDKSENKKQNPNRNKNNRRKKPINKDSNPVKPNESSGNEKA
jgi:cell fate regulator YaaT (PSP1 superfamily)